MMYCIQDIRTIQDHPQLIHGQQKESGSFRRHSPSSSSCSVVQRLVCGTDAKARQVGVGTASLSNYLSSQRNKSQNSKISPQSNSRRLYIMVCRVFLALLLQLSSQLFSQSPLLHFSLLHGYTVRFYKINSRLRLVSVIQSECVYGYVCVSVCARVRVCVYAFVRACVCV